MQLILSSFRKGRVGSFCADLALDPLRRLLHLRLDLLKSGRLPAALLAARRATRVPALRRGSATLWSATRCCGQGPAPGLPLLRAPRPTSTPVHRVFSASRACTLVTSPIATTVSCNATCSLAMYVIRTFCATSCSREETLCTLQSGDTATSAYRRSSLKGNVPDASLRQGLL